MREIRVPANLRANLLPRQSGDGKLGVVHHNDKMWIAGGNLDSRNSKPVSQRDGSRRERGNAHPGGHFHGKLAVCLQRIYAADAQTRIGGNFHFIARQEAAFQRHPCRHATRAVAADLGDRAVGIAQSNAARLRSGPRKEFNAIGAHACIARAELSRQLRAVAALNGFLGHNQKIVAAGVSFSKWNQSSSKSMQVK